MNREKAARLHSVIVASRQMVDDKTASIAPELFGRLKEDGSLVKVGTRINWNGTIKKVAADLWDTAENNPDNAPSLWQDIEYKEGYRIIPDVLTVTTAFAKDECAWWEDKLYRSLLDANAYTPGVYPQGWEMV